MAEIYRKEASNTINMKEIIETCMSMFGRCGIGREVPRVSEALVYVVEEACNKITDLQKVEAAVKDATTGKDVITNNAAVKQVLRIRGMLEVFQTRLTRLCGDNTELVALKTSIEEFLTNEKKDG